MFCHWTLCRVIVKIIYSKIARQGTEIYNNKIKKSAKLHQIHFVPPNITPSPACLLFVMLSFEVSRTNFYSTNIGSGEQEKESREKEQSQLKKAFVLRSDKHHLFPACLLFVLISLKVSRTNFYSANIGFSYCFGSGIAKSWWKDNFPKKHSLNRCWLDKKKFKFVYCFSVLADFH